MKKDLMNMSGKEFSFEFIGTCKGSDFVELLNIDSKKAYEFISRRIEKQVKKACYPWIEKFGYGKQENEIAVNYVATEFYYLCMENPKAAIKNLLVYQTEKQRYFIGEKRFLRREDAIIYCALHGIETDTIKKKTVTVLNSTITRMLKSLNDSEYYAGKKSGEKVDTINLDSPIDSEGENSDTIQDTIVNNHYNVESNALKRYIIDTALSKASEKVRAYAELYYTGYTFKEIADYFGVGETAIITALKRLGKYSK